MLSEIKSWITGYIRSVLESVIRVAVVDSVDPARGTARVRLEDESELISFDLRVVVRKAHKDFDYWLPDPGDQVLCFFLPFGLEQGFVLGSLYSRSDPVPVESSDKRHVLFSDGTWLEYDRKKHNLSGHIKGKVDGLVIEKDAVIDIGGDVTETVGGSVSAEIGKDLAARVGQNAEVTAGAQISLNAPIIKLMGNLSSAGSSGGVATETKEADTEHTGSYKLTGDLEVDGSIHATGDILADGANVNHHSH